jgi:hypothetical protein
MDEHRVPVCVSLNQEHLFARFDWPDALAICFPFRIKVNLASATTSQEVGSVHRKANSLSLVGYRISFMMPVGITIVEDLPDSPTEMYFSNWTLYKTNESYEELMGEFTATK